MNTSLPFFLLFLELYATVILAAATPPPPPLALPSPSNPDPNAASPFNTTQPGSLSHLPKTDPTTTTIPSTTSTLTLFNYGRSLPRRSVHGIFQAASRDVAYNVKQGHPMMGRRPLRYTAGNVHLLVHASDEMTWEVWGTVIGGLEEWFERWEFVECDVDVGKVGGLGYWYGTGVLVMIDKGLE